MTEAAEGDAGAATGLFAKILAFLAILLVEVVLIALDPISFSSVTQGHSARIADRVMAPFYGYDADPEAGAAAPTPARALGDRPLEEWYPAAAEATAAAPISAATRNITVVLIDDQSLRNLNTHWPMPYHIQERVFRRILRLKPRALFIDLAYTYDRDNLDRLIDRLEADGARLTTAGALTGAGGAAVSETGVVLAVIGQAIQWSDQEAVDRIRNGGGVDRGIVAFEDLEEGYTLFGRLEANDGSGRIETVPSAAFRLYEIACDVDARADAPRRIGFPGCADLPANPAGGPRVWPETEPREWREPMSVRWGALDPEMWQLLGDHVGQDTSAIRAIEAETGGDRCRYFGADAEDRLLEGGRQFLNAFALLRAREVAEICPYHVTLRAFDLFATNARVPDYVRWAIEDKIVIVGASVLAASDRIDIMDTEGPGVFLHAMALDNLLHYGAGYLREPRSMSTYAGDIEVGGALLRETTLGGVQANVLLEIVTVGAIIALYFLLRGRLTRTCRRITRVTSLQRLLHVLIWSSVATIVAAIGLAFAYWVMSWPPHNWLGALLYAGVASRIVNGAFPMESAPARSV